MKYKLLIYAIPVVLIILLFVLQFDIDDNFNYLNVLNIELTLYLAIIAIMPLFDIFKKLNKVKVNSFKSNLDLYIELLIKGFIFLFITYFIYALSFIELPNMINYIYDVVFLYFYLMNLIVLFLIIKTFLRNIKNSNLNE